MRIAAPLILALASSVALAEPPYSGFMSNTTDDVVDASAYSIQNSAAPLINGRGDDWSMWQSSGVAPAETGYAADTDMHGSDFVRSPNKINEWLADGDRIRRD